MGYLIKVVLLIQTSLGVNYPLPEVLESIEDKSELVLAIRAEHVQLCSENNPQSIAIEIEFVDDMGADKLLSAKCIKNGTNLSLRVSADKPLASGQLYIELPKMKLHGFHQQTGKRIGDWRE